jgi:hypothetical protein
MEIPRYLTGGPDQVYLSGLPDSDGLASQTWKVINMSSDGTLTSLGPNSLK